MQTDLDSRANLLIIDKFGQEMPQNSPLAPGEEFGTRDTPFAKPTSEQRKKKQGVYRLLYTVSDKVQGYSFAVENLRSDKELRIFLDCSKSQKMLFSTPTPCIVKDIRPGQKEFFMHCIAIPSEVESA